ARTNLQSGSGLDQSCLTACQSGISVLCRAARRPSYLFHHPHRAQRCYQAGAFGSKLKRMIHRFRPELIVPSITDLKPEFFHSQGLQAALLDVDNTLVLWHGTEVDPAISGWIARMKAEGIRFCLASNTRRARRLASLGDSLGIPYELGVA